MRWGCRRGRSRSPPRRAGRPADPRTGSRWSSRWSSTRPRHAHGAVRRAARVGASVARARRPRPVILPTRLHALSVLRPGPSRSWRRGSARRQRTAVWAAGAGAAEVALAAAQRCARLPPPPLRQAPRPCGSRRTPSTGSCPPECWRSCSPALRFSSIWRSQRRGCVEFRLVVYLQ